MPHGNWDDISPTQRDALRKLRDTPKGIARAAHLRGVRLTTLRALHRFGLVQSDDSFIVEGSLVTITESGRLGAGET